MNKKKSMQLIAAFMISLVLTIPFEISASASIDQISAAGSDKIEGFVRQSDFIDFNVLASLDGSQVTNDKIFLGSSIKFDKCSSAQNNETVCTLRYPKTAKQEFESGPVPYTLTLFNDSAKTKLIDTQSSNVFVDNKAPEITLSLSKNLLSGKDKIVITYEAKDAACSDPICADKCVGIKNIVFHTIDDSFAQTVTPNATDASGCTFKSKLTIEANKFKDGKTSVIAAATDNFGQSSPEVSSEFTIDSTAPTILASAFAIKRKGVSISTYSKHAVPVEVSIKVSAGDLDVNSVAADLTALNPELTNVKAACAPSALNIYLCKWNIDLNPTGGSSVDSVDSIAGETTATDTQSSSSGSGRIIINASDIIGNTASVVISKAMALDDQGPVIQSLTVPTQKDGKFYVKSSDTVTAVLSEVTGLSAGEIFLHAGSSIIPATSCKKQAGWICTWDKLNFASGKVQLSIGSDSIDFLLNPVSDSKSIEVIVDNVPPVLTGISIESVGSLSDKFPNLFKVEDKIKISANITEANDLEANGDFSRFIKDAKNVPAQCERIDGSRQNCKWLTDSITTAASNIIKLNFSDFAGNFIIVSQPLTVLDLEAAALPDFWNNKVKCAPETVDRQLGPFINQRVYCQVKLYPQSAAQPKSTILLLSDADCQATSPILESAETFNNEKGSTSPIIKLTLKQDDFKINEVNFSCSFTINSRIGDKIVKNPEIETANITVKFYNLPLGEVSESVQQDIEQAKKDTQGLWKVIGAMNKVIASSKKICQVYGVIYNLISIKYTITVIHKSVTQGICTSPLAMGCAASLASSTTFCTTQQAARQGGQQGWKAANKFCKFVNCQISIGPLEKWRQYATSKINELPLAKRLSGGELRGQPGQEFQPGSEQTGQQQTSQDNKAKIPVPPTPDDIQGGLSSYMDPNNNLVVAAAFGCVPGVISGLEKIRQIKCLYADCLINSVGKDGLPPTACEDQKSYALCKYGLGELFAIIPYTAVFDYFTNIVKEAFSNPFSALGTGISAMCYSTCPNINTAPYVACETVKLISQIGDVVGNIKGLVNEGNIFKSRQDYCSRIDFGEESSEENE